MIPARGRGSVGGGADSEGGEEWAGFLVGLRRVKLRALLHLTCEWSSSLVVFSGHTQQRGDGRVSAGGEGGWDSGVACGQASGSGS